MTSDSSTPLGSASSNRLATGIAATAASAEATTSRGVVSRQRHGSSATNGGRQARKALKRSVAAPSSSRMPARRSVRPRSPSHHASSPVAAISAPAIRQSFSTAPISASGTGSSAQSASAIASPIRPRRSAQPARSA